MRPDRRTVLGGLMASPLGGCVTLSGDPAAQTVWRFGDLDSIAAPLTIEGSPEPIDGPAGLPGALLFDGVDDALFIGLHAIKTGKPPADGQHNPNQGKKLAAACTATWQYTAKRFLRLANRIIYIWATAALAAATTATRRRLAPRARWARIAPGALTATIIIPGHERRGLQQMNVKNERPKTGRDASSGKPTPI